MATENTLLNDLVTLKNILRSLYLNCRKERSGLFYYVTPELKRLYAAASDARVAISSRDHRDERKFNQTIAELDNLRLLSIEDLQKLQDELVNYVRRRQNRIRIDEQDIKRRVETLALRFDDQCRAFLRIIDAVHGREDWSRLSPKEPSSGARSSSKPTPEPSPPNPKITISAPTSPYQPTVEDVEDDPSDEPSTVESYHYVHPTDTPPVAGKQPARTPPVVLVRAPTDGLTEKGGESSKAPQSSATKQTQAQKANGFASPPSRKGEEKGPRSEREGDDDDHGDSLKASKRVAQTPRDKRPLHDIQAEIERLQAEIDRRENSLNDHSPPPTPSGKSRVHHPSMDLGVTDKSLHTQNPGQRNRAMTASGLERPTKYEKNTESLRPGVSPKPSPREPPHEYAGPSVPRKVRQSPRESLLRDSFLRPNQSPRTPQSAVEMGSSPWLDNMPPIDEGYASSRKRDVYGADPRRSFPAVNESSSTRYTQGPGFAGTQRTHRYSENYGARPVDVERAFNDWLNTSEGRKTDFDLFGPSPLDDRTGGRPTQQGGRIRGRQVTREPRESPLPDETRPPVVERELPVTLEEMFTGTIKTFKLRKTSIDPETGRLRDEAKQLEVPIYRGLKPGSKIKFEGEGGISPEGYKQDLHFIIVEKAHPVFTRRDRDLHTIVEVTLAESLLGWQRTITSICGKTVRVSHEGPTPPSWQEPFAGLGLCSYRDPEERGDLIVAVKIKYPGPLSERQKTLIRAALMEK